MLAFKRIPNEYTDDRLREAGFQVVYYEDIEWKGGAPYVNRQRITDDAWYFRAVGGQHQTVTRLIGYAHAIGAVFFDDYLADTGPGNRDKWNQYSILQAAGITQPTSALFNSLREALDSINTYPTVVKATRHGRRGLYTFKVSSANDKSRVVDELSGRDQYRGRDTQWMTQSYIPNRGDYRAIVVGNECLGIIKRRPKDGVDLVMSTSDGASRRFKGNRWPRPVGNVAVRAASAMGVTVAGVDLVKNTRTNEVVVVEVNEAPSFQVFEKRIRSRIVTEAIARELQSR